MPGLTRPFPERVIPFHGRPLEVMAMQGFADALLSQITDPAVKAISEQPPIGGLDQFSDNTDLKENPSFVHRIRQLYR
ncbi:MAG: hypothetical protein GY759_05025 [Chloroflexi bacterium]|nr:hypothetical protein [Chloroflexota bacterium]